MSTLTLAIDNGTPGTGWTSSSAAAGKAPWILNSSLDSTMERFIDEGDIVLTLLWHARSFIERIAERRRVGNLVRNGWKRADNWRDSRAGSAMTCYPWNTSLSQHLIDRR